MRAKRTRVLNSLTYQYAVRAKRTGALQTSSWPCKAVAVHYLSVRLGH